MLLADIEEETVILKIDVEGYECKVWGYNYNIHANTHEYFRGNDIAKYTFKLQCQFPICRKFGVI